MNEVYVLADKTSFHEAIIEPTMMSHNQDLLDKMRIYPWAVGDVDVILRAKKVFAVHVLEDSYREFALAASDCVMDILPAGSGCQAFKDIIAWVNPIALKKIKQRQWNEDANNFYNPIQMIDEAFAQPDERLKPVKAPNLELSALHRCFSKESPSVS